MGRNAHLVNLHTRSMDGTTFVRSVRSEPAFADVPIIAFNAHDMPESHDQALRDGFDAVISKPCLPEDLVTLMRPFLQADRDSDIQG
jgi:two-component system sensor histidine kinase/response regulator